MSTPPIENKDLREKSAGTDEGLPEDTFQTEQVLTVASAHFTHDTFSAFVAPLLPVIQAKLSINYTQSGTLVALMQLPSLLNPFIGYMADRISLRYFVILAPAVTATLMSVMGLAPNYLVLALLLLATGVSVAAFHAPAPAMIARLAGRRVGTGMSVFMAAGELGRTVGPVIVAWAVAYIGLEGMWRLAFVGWAVSAILYWRLRHISARPAPKAAVMREVFWPRAKRIFPLLIALQLCRSLLLGAMTTYLPLFMTDVVNAEFWLAATALTILEGAGVVGALTAGTTSDRLGRYRVLFVQLLISPLLLLSFVYIDNQWALPLLLLLGFFAISPTPVLLALVQDKFADSRAFANGIFLASNFLIRALGIWLVGFLADRIGLSNAFLVSGFVALGSLVPLLILPRMETKLG